MLWRLTFSPFPFVHWPGLFQQPQLLCGPSELPSNSTADITQGHLVPPCDLHADWWVPPPAGGAARVEPLPDAASWLVSAGVGFSLPRAPFLRLCPSRCYVFIFVTAPGLRYGRVDL